MSHSFNAQKYKRQGHRSEFLVQRGVKIGHISGRMTVQFDNNCTDQKKVYGWVERFVGKRTRVDARSGGLMPITCVDFKGTDPHAHAGEQNINITFFLTRWGFKFLSHGLCKRQNFEIRAF